MFSGRVRGVCTGDHAELGDELLSAYMAVAEVLIVLEALDGVGCRYWLRGAGASTP